MTLRIRGEDVASSVREWIKDDIKKSPSARVELGKFFVGISSGSVGLFATLLKFATEAPTIDYLTSGCFALWLLSMGLGLYMAIPKVLSIRSDLDLYEVYNGDVKGTVKLIQGWASLWLLGFIFGAVKLFS